VDIYFNLYAQHQEAILSPESRFSNKWEQVVVVVDDDDNSRPFSGGRARLGRDADRSPHLVPRLRIT
jgi:hypothetical protein